VIEDFFDLRIATIRRGEPEPPDAHIVRIDTPSALDVDVLAPQGWFYKPRFVTYIIVVPPSLDAYIDGMFRSRARNKPRRLLREVPERYRLVVDERGEHVPAFVELYGRTVVDRPRGKDRVAEYEDGFGEDWIGYHLFDGDRIVAGVLVQKSGGHLSIAYGAFEEEHRKQFDLEHFLIMQVLRRAIGLRHPLMSLGMDTNRYGHHLSLGLPAYKLRLGFAPAAYEPAGRELVRVQSFDVFGEGLFFYAYGGGWLEGHFFHRGEPDLRPFEHHQAPPVTPHPIVDLRQTPDSSF
jgi:hypothetical protein